MTHADTLSWLQRCADVARSGAPMTDIERARHRGLCAAEDARAEARRAAPSPQLELPKVA